MEERVDVAQAPGPMEILADGSDHFHAGYLEAGASELGRGCG